MKKVIARLTQFLGRATAYFLPLVLSLSFASPEAAQAQSAGAGGVGASAQQSWNIFCYNFDREPDWDTHRARNPIAIRNDCQEGAVGFDLVGEFDLGGNFMHYRVANVTDGNGQRVPYEDPNSGPFSYSICEAIDRQADVNWNRDINPTLNCDINIRFETEGAHSGENYTYLILGRLSASFIDHYAMTYNFTGNLIRTAHSVGAQPDLTAPLTAQYMQQRSSALLSSQPDLTGLLRGDRRVSNRVEVSNGMTAVDLGFGDVGPVWGELSAAWSTRDGSDLSYAFGVVGAHVELGERTRLGAMVQLDYAQMDDPFADVSGQGWLAGPYVITRAASAPVFFEGYVLYGQSSNDVRMFDGSSGRFETERWLASLKLSGEVQRGATTWIPQVRLAYTEDGHDGFVDALGYDVPDQSVALGEMSVGLGFRHTLSVRSEVTGAINWVGSYERTHGGVDALNTENTSGRGRIELGWSHKAGAGTSVSLLGYWDGIGRDRYDVRGLSFELSRSF